MSGIAGLAMLIFLSFGGEDTLDPFDRPIGTDFSAFWHAGRMANGGNAVGAWDVGSLNAEVRETHAGSDFATAWVYPPVFLLIASPLAVLPYLHALAIWQLASVLLMAWTLQSILRGWRSTAICLASPLTPLVLAHGQNAFVTASLLGTGLLSLAKARNSAGGCFGGLVYKPQLGLQLAPLLLFTRNWRAVAAAVAVGTILIAASLAIWGIDAWNAFAGSAQSTRLFMENGAVGFHKSASLFSMARLWGAPLGPSYVIQALGALAGLGLMWRARSAPRFVLCAAACAAVALSTPYLLDYDMATVGLGAVFLFAEARRTSFLSFERTALAYIWVTPWFARQAVEHAHLPVLPISMMLLAFLAFRRATLAEGAASPTARMTPTSSGREA